MNEASKPRRLRWARPREQQKSKLRLGHKSGFGKRASRRARASTFFGERQTGPGKGPRAKSRANLILTVQYGLTVVQEWMPPTTSWRSSKRSLSNSKWLASMRVSACGLRVLATATKTTARPRQSSGTTTWLSITLTSPSEAYVAWPVFPLGPPRSTSPPLTVADREIHQEHNELRRPATVVQLEGASSGRGEARQKPPGFPRGLPGTTRCRRPIHLGEWRARGV